MSKMTESIINRIVSQPLGGRSGGARAGSGPRASASGAQKFHTNGHRTFGGAKGHGTPAHSQGYSAAPKDRGAGIAGGKDTSRDPVNLSRKPKGKSGIHIKKSHEGRLHKKLGVKAGHKISEKSLERAKRSKSPALRKEATFAENAKHWNHGGGGQSGGAQELHVHIHAPGAGGY